jgi:hypothetical protein
MNLCSLCNKNEIVEMQTYLCKSCADYRKKARKDYKLPKQIEENSSTLFCTRCKKQVADTLTKEAVLCRSCADEESELKPNPGTKYSGPTEAKGLTLADFTPDTKAAPPKRKPTAKEVMEFAGIDTTKIGEATLVLKVNDPNVYCNLKGML